MTTGVEVPGEQGAPGDRGAQGVPGHQGEPGHRGEPGKQGHVGKTGEIGPKGHRGNIRLWPWVVLMLGVVLIGIAAIDKKTQRADDRLRDKAAALVVLSQKREAWSRYHSGIEACVRGNVIREQERAQTAFSLAEAKIIREFLDSSARFRRASGQEDLALESLALKAKLLKEAANLHPPDNVICADVIVKPPYPEPKKDS